MLTKLKRYLPALAFFAGFIFDALTLGQRVKAADFWQLGSMLLAAALLILLLAQRAHRGLAPPCLDETCHQRWQQRWRTLRWQAPYLLLQFLFGGIFSALFIFYFKSSGHFGTALMAGLLGALLLANEFIGRQYAQRFTLTWGLFGLNAILLMNFALPHLAGSLNPAWFYLSTASGALLTHALYHLAPGQPGRILPAWCIAATLLLAWQGDMIAPVPLVKRQVVIGQQFSQVAGQYQLQVETAPAWQFWRDLATTVHVAKNGRLYGVSAIFAPLGVSAALEHRWQWRDPQNQWQTISRVRFQASGGREQGFRGYSYVPNPKPGAWQLLVATQDGRTISILHFQVETGDSTNATSVTRNY